jgi:putative heme-binding domain-containing protein
MLKHIALVTAAFFTASAQDVSRLDLLTATALKIDSATVHASLLKGMKDSLAGQRGVAAPKGWAELAAKLKDSPDADVRARVQELSVIFGGGAAMDEMRAKLADAAAPLDARKQALDSLVAQKDAGALDSVLKLSAEAGPLREPALRGLAGFDDARIAPQLTAQFARLDTAERRAALQTLLARSSGARAFLAAIDSGAIAKTELNAPIARQLDGLKEPDVSAWLAKNWGAVSAPNENKQKLIAKFKEFTGAEAVARADANHGRALFAQSCAVCHTMFGTGGHIGPELTGGYGDVDYLLSNVLDPNAIIGKDYQQNFVKTKDGQTVAGIVTQDTDSAVTLKNLAGEVVTLQKSDVASTELSPLSMMPEGLITAMDEESVRDLFHYLAQKAQVPMLVTAVNANDFYTGTDLRNWRVDGAWKWVAGEIVVPGGAKPVSLQSEMLMGDGKLSFRMKSSGKGTAEIALAGKRTDSRFVGESLSIGGDSAMNIWIYSADKPEPTSKALSKAAGEDWRSVGIERRGEKVVVKIDGEVVHESAEVKGRLAPSFYFVGEGAELRIKDVRAEAN